MHTGDAIGYSVGSGRVCSTVRSPDFPERSMHGLLGFGENSLPRSRKAQGSTERRRFIFLLRQSECDSTHIENAACIPQFRRYQIARCPYQHGECYSPMARVVHAIDL